MAVDAVLERERAVSRPDVARTIGRKTSSSRT